MEKTDNLWKNSLFLLKVLGLYTKTKSRKVLILTVLYSLVLIFMVSMTLLQFFNVKDVSEFLENLVPFNGFAQVLAKTVITGFQQEKLIKMLNASKQFWKTNVCEDKMKAELDALALHSLRLQKCFLYCVILSALLADISAVNRPLPTGVWNTHGHVILYHLTLAAQLFGLPIMGFFISAFDTLFLSFATETVIQFRILCYSLRKLSVFDISSEEAKKEHYAKMVLLIKQHVFLLRFLHSLQDYFSIGMLAGYATISTLICAEMYAFLESNGAELLAKHLVICMSLVLQLGFYCYTADFISSEALAVSDAIYDSDWYSKYLRTLPTPVTLLIQRSQQRVVFTAGGLIEMNIRTLLVVLRVSYSTCTVVRRLKTIQ